MPFTIFDFECSGSVCRGNSSKVTEAFKDLQRQLNRHKAGIKVDGIIGNQTVQAARRIMNNEKLTKEGLAMMADTYAGQLAKVPLPEFPVEVPGGGGGEVVGPVEEPGASSRKWLWIAIAGGGGIMGLLAIILLSSGRKRG